MSRSSTDIIEFLVEIASEPSDLTIDVSRFRTAQVEVLPGMVGRDQAVARAIRFYVLGTFTFDEFDTAIDAIFAA